MKVFPALTGLTAFVLATLASAHHSSTMFDNAREVSLEGTVREFQYTNPHSWLIVAVQDASGKSTDWSFETVGPSNLIRAGIRKDSLKPGEKVTVKGHPLIDGRPAAGLMSVTKADGTVLYPNGGPGKASE